MAEEMLRQQQRVMEIVKGTGSEDSDSEDTFNESIKET